MLTQRLTALGFDVVALDNDAAMVEPLRSVFGSEHVVNANAWSFELDERADAMIVHSGHLIFSRHGSSIALNVEGTANRNDALRQVRTALASVVASLTPQSVVLLNFEIWDDRISNEFTDGSVYVRRVVGSRLTATCEVAVGERLEIPRTETRVHLFYDTATPERIYRELIIERPKFPFDDFVALAREAGLETEEPDETAGFVVCRRMD